MEKKDYIVNGKDIYVGEVIRANGIYRRITTGNDVAGCLDVKKLTYIETYYLHQQKINMLMIYYIILLIIQY